MPRKKTAKTKTKSKTSPQKKKVKAEIKNGQANRRTKYEHLVWFTVMLVGVFYIFLFIGLMYVGSVNKKILNIENYLNNQSRMLEEIHNEVVPEQQAIYKMPVNQRK
ncbi:MAG: hypothetical protein GF347_04505 [Candidatus Moranbacteria bacterium]|nr:hypothetical protein [Candidatus Moranbacteria bacterium]